MNKENPTKAFEIINGKWIKVIHKGDKYYTPKGYDVIRLSSITQLIAISEGKDPIQYISITPNLRYNTIILYRNTVELIQFNYGKEGKDEFEKDLKILENLLYQ